MREKIDISFLKETEIMIDESLDIIKDYPADVQPVKSIRFSLNSAKNTVRKIIDSGIRDFDNILTLNPSDLPELLWIRYTAAQIVKTMDTNAHKHPFNAELTGKMHEIYRQFDNIYQSTVVEA